MKTQTIKKLIIFGAFALMIGYKAFAQNDPFDAAAESISGFGSSMLRLFDVLIGVGLLIGGIFVFYKMKTGEGSEGKKALMNTVGAILFAVVIRVIVQMFLV